VGRASAATATYPRLEIYGIAGMPSAGRREIEPVYNGPARDGLPIPSVSALRLALR